MEYDRKSNTKAIVICIPSLCVDWIRLKQTDLEFGCLLGGGFRGKAICLPLFIIVEFHTGTWFYIVLAMRIDGGQGVCVISGRDCCLFMRHPEDLYKTPFNFTTVGLYNANKMFCNTHCRMTQNMLHALLLIYKDVQLSSQNNGSMKPK